MPSIGAVVIGRNEGKRLERCLASLRERVQCVVYVDSGSSDGSPERARVLGVESVELDPAAPFTAARARNAGFRRLCQIHPELEFVQFVDGDCELAEKWIEHGLEAMRDPDVGVSCGRRRERHPERSLYNQLCDIEWNTPIGVTTRCGGDALMRAEALSEVGGFDEALIAGEEPELCIRLREYGWKILRVDADMTLHDANLERFSQWWVRGVRAGHAYAHVAAIHGWKPARYAVHEVRSNWFWGLGVPAAALLGAVPSGGWSLLLLAGYPVLVLKIVWSDPKPDLSPSSRALYGLSCALGKFCNALGQLHYQVARLGGRRAALIEYKGIGS